MPRIATRPTAKLLLQLVTMLAVFSCARCCVAQSHFSEPRRSMSAAAAGPSGGMQPHPSIVRVIAEDTDSQSRGSGTLIGVDEEHGYVLTNWHVVRDVTGRVLVQFPDGFESAATVIKTDDTWDLALLVIWRPEANPMPLSPNPPQPGESLIIAGYGQGPFRAARGTFTDHASPSETAPFDMLEVSTAARHGDSGGPMINERGELAGVLFGTGGGMTTGTKVDRIRKFLDHAFQPDLGDGPSMQPRPGVFAQAATPLSQQAAALRVDTPTAGGQDLAVPAEVLADIPMSNNIGEFDSQFANGNYGVSDNESRTPLDQVKTFLVVIGIFAVLLQLLPR